MARSGHRAGAAIRPTWRMEQSAYRKPILIAAGPQVEERLRRVLAEHRLTSTRTLSQAVSLLDQQEFGMVIVDVHFDDSQMFELLHHIRINRQDAAVPIVCILGAHGTLSKVLIVSLNYAVKAMTANAFLDFAKMTDDAAGNGRLRRIIEYLILIDGELHQGIDDD